MIISNDTLINGIDENVVLKLVSDGITDPTIVYERINKFEKYEFSKETSFKKSYKKIFHDINFKKSNKWCKLVKSKYHDDNECIVHKRNSEQKINNVKNYSLPFIFANLNLYNPLKILIDSGAEKLFINYNIIKRSNFKIDKTSIISIKRPRV
ncbi:hypothetical protein DMUE_4237 [Dictyocoela muelleri]|nr:hypothetical protein DMUE_4237 [Dictyocoela muelleri]